MAPMSEAQRGIVSTIREFVRREVNPVAQQMEHDDEYPVELVERMKELGLFGAIIPEEYGGAGLPIRGGGVILETVNAMGCSASAGHAQMYTMGTILRHGSDEQKAHYLPRIASGELRLQAFGVTEPTSG